MITWILLFSLFVPAAGTQATAADQADSEAAALDDAPMRYRGIEQLLAKFDAEQD